MLYGTVLLTATGLVSQGLGFLYRIALSRLIGAEVMGLYQLIMPVYSVLLSLTAVGLTSAVSTLSSTYHALDNRKAAGQVLKSCLKAFFLLIAVTAAVVVLFYDPISVYLLGDARTQLGLLLLLPCIALTGIENLHKHFFYGAGHVRPPAVTELLEQFIRTGAVLGLLLCFLPQNPERTVGLIVLGMVICEVFSAVTLLLLYRREKRRGLTGQGERPKTVRRRVVSIAVPIGATALAGNLMGAANSVLIPQRLVAGGATASEAMSAFGVLCGMTLPMLMLPTAFLGALGLMLVPKMAENAALGKKEAVKDDLHSAMSATSAISLPAMALLVVLGPTIGQALFREQTVGNYILPLAVAVALDCYRTVFAASLNGIGKQPTTARISIFCGAVQLLFTFGTVKTWGLAGYAAGFVVSDLIGALLTGRAFCKAAGVKLRLFQWVAAPGLSSLLMGLVVNLLFHILPQYGLTAGQSTALCIPFGVVLYLAAMSAQGCLPFRKRRSKE
ncbi:MAG: oligosaccharide flippase family protein [Oscillospiraceae bacterium]|nr:oligosaccharide flippase family protein [Oscillospiraceae bacterium]